ncbi:MAG: internal scaffolding protein [Microvirus sp.]|nr:MAG: internal scaffolding protein [Microvirus sp.]
MRHRFKYRLANDMDADIAAGDAAITINDDESLTQQQFGEDADLNILAVRFGLTGKPLPVEAIDPRYYGDMTDLPDLRSALDLVNDARNKFMELPSKLRTRFDNEPHKLWAFVNDPDNSEEAVRLGLLARLPEPALQAETPPEGAQGT